MKYRIEERMGKFFKVFLVFFFAFCGGTTLRIGMKLLFHPSPLWVDMEKDWQIFLPASLCYFAAMEFFIILSLIWEAREKN